MLQLKKDWRALDLPAQDRAILGFAEKLTRTPSRLTRDDHAPLRAVGLDDTGILQVTLIASFFNYVSRVADALGVGKGD